MLTQLEVLAHNVLVWAQKWLSTDKPALKQFGFVRLSACAEIFTDQVTVFEWFQRLFSVINFA